jgi:hypothetical protein
MKYRILSLFALGVFAMTAPAADKADTRIFELRTYTAAPGKMDNLHARFRDHTCKLLEKHGMTLIGFWVPTDPKGAEQTLFYIVAHASEDAAKKSWDDFRKDPDWIKAKTESEKNGPIVSKVESKFFKPTDYSKTK